MSLELSIHELSIRLDVTDAAVMVTAAIELARQVITRVRGDGRTGSKNDHARRGRVDGTRDASRPRRRVSDTRRLPAGGGEWS
jgi:hypothetical protein